MTARRPAGRQDGGDRQADRLLLARGGAGSRDAASAAFYDVLGPNTISYEDGSYVKLRELSVVVQHRRDQTHRRATGASRPSAETCTRGRSTRVGIRMPAAAADRSSRARCSRSRPSQLSADPQLHVHAFAPSSNPPLATCARRCRARITAEARRNNEGDSAYSHQRRWSCSRPPGASRTSRRRTSAIRTSIACSPRGASIESTIGAGYQTVHNAMSNTNNQPGVEVFGLESYSALNNFNLGTRAAIPRLPINNVIGAPSIFTRVHGARRTRRGSS